MDFVSWCEEGLNVKTDDGKTSFWQEVRMRSFFVHFKEGRDRMEMIFRILNESNAERLDL